MFQVMRRNDIGGLVATGRGEIFNNSDNAVDWIAQEAAHGRTYVVIPINGYPEYTVEETKSRTMHKLPVLLGSPT